MKTDVDRQLDALMALPWTLVRETTPEGDRIIRVAELPSVVATGASDAEIDADLSESLRESLRAYLHFGDPIPIPAGVAADPAREHC